MHHLKNRVNTVFATVVRHALPLARREIWRICKGLAHEELLGPEAKGLLKPVTRSQVQEAVAEMVQRRRDLIDRTGKDPAMTFPLSESEVINAITTPDVDASSTQRPKLILNEDKSNAREYEDPFHISKMLLNRAAKERVERVRRGAYRGARRLEDEFEPSLASWRRELYTIAQAISERFEERKNGRYAQETYLSRCSDVYARVRYVDVSIRQLEQAVQAAKIAKRAYMNSPARGRAERAALQEAEGRQPAALRRAQTIMAIEKTVNSLLNYKLPDWRAEIGAIHQSLTGLPLEKGTVYIRFGLEDNVHATAPVSPGWLKGKVWNMERDLNRLLKHDLPSWRAAIGLPPYEPAKFLPDERATHTHFRPRNLVPADAKLPGVDGVKGTLGMARESTRLHAMVYIQTAISLVGSEFSMWAHEVHAIERRRTRESTNSALYALASVYPRDTTGHISTEQNLVRLYTLEAFKRRFKRQLTFTFGPGIYPELDQLRFEDISVVPQRNVAFSRLYHLVKRRKLQFKTDVTEKPTKLSESEAQQWKDGVASLLSNQQILPDSETPGVTSDLIADALRRGESRTSLMRTLLDMLVLRRRAAKDDQTSHDEFDFAAHFRHASVMRWRRTFRDAMRQNFGFGRDYSVIDQLDHESLCFAKQRKLLFSTLSDMTRKNHACYKIYNVKTDEVARSEMARWKLATKFQLRTTFGPGEYSEVDDVTLETFRHDQQRSAFLLDLFGTLFHRQSIEAGTGALPQQQQDQDLKTQSKVKLSRHQRKRQQRAQAVNFVTEIETLRRDNDPLDSKQAEVEAKMESKQTEIIQELREAAKMVGSETEDYEALRKQIAIEMIHAQYRERERKISEMKSGRKGRQTIDKLRALQVIRLARSKQARSVALTNEEQALRSGPLFSEHLVEEVEGIVERHDSDMIGATSSPTAPSIDETETPVSLENERERAMVRLRKLLLGKNHAQEARNVNEAHEATLAYMKEQMDAKFTATTTTFRPTESRRAPLRQTIDPDKATTSVSTNETKAEPRQQRQSHGHLTHLTPSGTAYMVNITPKTSTHRLAIAIGTVSFSNPETLGLVRSAALKKGDVLGVARIAGIQAAKLCPMIIPLCHPIAISGVEVDVTVLDAVSALQDKETRIENHTRQEDKRLLHSPSSSRTLTTTSTPLEYGGIHVVARVDCVGPTGVEMEALTAVTGACLTVVDMVKAVDRGASIGDVRVVRKMGGRSGEWVDEGYIDK